MSLYRYKVTVPGGKEMSGGITAKTESEARERLAERIAVVNWLSFKEERPANSPAPPKVQPPKFQPPKVQPPKVQMSKAQEPKAQVPKPLSKLRKMLYLQLDRCFFCGEPLREQDASIEHLNPKSKGGYNTDDNLVVCHATLNQTFGSMDLKRKFEFTLRAARPFKCPAWEPARGTP